MIDGKPATKRTTLTLPFELLDQAEDLAMAEHATVSTVIAKALSIGLPQIRPAKAAEDFLASYRKAFEIPGVSEEDLLALDGIVLDSVGPDNPDPDEEESHGA
jgi:hypothetical protein